MRASAFGICVGAVLIFATGQAQCEEKVHEFFTGLHGLVEAPCEV